MSCSKKSSPGTTDTAPSDLNVSVVISTDSKLTPLRWGVTGISLCHSGFRGLNSYIGKPDIYNHPLKVTQINILDSLASAAVFVMGEGAEQTPMAMIKHAPHITFLDRTPSEDEQKSIIIDLEEDLYAPLLKSAQWE